MSSDLLCGTLRWSELEIEQIGIVRQKCAEELAEQPPFPEVTGDRRIVRIIRAYRNEGIEKAVEYYRKFLRWRKEFNIDRIRNHIALGNANDPNNFPYAELMNKFAPQIVCDSAVRDAYGQPIAMETYNFKPREVFQSITLNQYILYLIYTLEYKSLVMEQVSHDLETEKMDVCNNDPPSSPGGFGVVCKICFFRDLNGLGAAHLVQEGRDMVRVAVRIAQDYYPEALSKSYMVNTPWAFTALWNFIKMFLHPRTVAKFAFLSGSYYTEIAKELAPESIPERLGGEYKGFNPKTTFRTQPGGPLHCEGAVAPPPWSDEELDSLKGISFLLEDTKSPAKKSPKKKKDKSLGKTLSRSSSSLSNSGSLEQIAASPPSSPRSSLGISTYPSSASIGLTLSRSTSEIEGETGATTTTTSSAAASSSSTTTTTTEVKSESDVVSNAGGNNIKKKKFSLFGFSWGSKKESVSATVNTATVPGVGTANAPSTDSSMVRPIEGPQGLINKVPIPVKEKDRTDVSSINSSAAAVGVKDKSNVKGKENVLSTGKSGRVRDRFTASPADADNIGDTSRVAVNASAPLRRGLTHPVAKIPTPRGYREQVPSFDWTAGNLMGGELQPPVEPLYMQVLVWLVYLLAGIVPIPITKSNNDENKTKSNFSTSTIVRAVLGVGLLGAAIWILYSRNLWIACVMPLVVLLLLAVVAV